MRLLLHSGDSATEVVARRDGDDVVLDRAAVEATTGWEAKDHGLCRGDVCRPAALGDTVTLAELARLLGRPLAGELDDDVTIAALGDTVPRVGLAGLLAPPLAVELDDDVTIAVLG